MPLHRFLLIIAGACCGACAVAPIAPADALITNARVVTMNPAQPAADALAIRDGRIVWVGAGTQADAYAGAQTTTIDAGGNTVLPGLVDGHIHAVRGALTIVYDCTFAFTATPDEVAETIRRCVEEQPDADWIRGGQWDSGFFERYAIESPREFLDAVSKDKAVFLTDDSLHNAWVNSRALELAGVTAATPDPSGGKFERDAAGVPNGVLIETAQKQLLALVPKYTREQHARAAGEFAKLANRWGITAIKDAGPTVTEIEGYFDADRAGTLTLHTAMSMRTPYGHREQPLDYDSLIERRDRYRTDKVDTRFVKIFLDGVPTPARTAAMLDPYVADADHGERFDGGPVHVGLETLSADLTRLDSLGFTVKMHAAGDRSVRIALDAIEATRKANGDSGLRHELAHAGYIAPDDVPRFAELGAVADLSPAIWFPSPIIDAVLAATGERGEHYWPVRDLVDAGAPLLAGSDWPAAVPDANPWTGIEGLVTRRNPAGAAPGALWPEQAVTLDEALRIYTIEGAKALRLDSETGSLEPGKLADIIVLDRDLFASDPDEIDQVQVVQTLFAGKTVHRNTP